MRLVIHARWLAGDQSRQREALRGDRHHGDSLSRDISIEIKDPVRAEDRKRGAGWFEVRAQGMSLQHSGEAPLPRAELLAADQQCPAGGGTEQKRAIQPVTGQQRPGACVPAAWFGAEQHGLAVSNQSRDPASRSRAAHKPGVEEIVRIPGRDQRLLSFPGKHAETVQRPAKLGDGKP